MGKFEELTQEDTKEGLTHSSCHLQTSLSWTNRLAQESLCDPQATWSPSDIEGEAEQLSCEYFQGSYSRSQG